MTGHECLAPERTDAILRLSADHPDRRAAENCPRCRELLTSYRDFLDGEAAAAYADRAAGLLTFLDRGGAGTPRSPAPRSRRRLWAGGTLIAAAVVSLVFLGRPDPPPSLAPTGQERGGVTDGLPLHEAQTRGSELRVEWSALPEADNFVFVLYDADLAEIVRYDLGKATRASLDLSIWATPGTTVAWRILAQREGSDLAQSGLRTAELP